MAAILVLPGFGGAYTSEAFPAVTVDSVGGDVLDLTRLDRFAVSVNSTLSEGAGFQYQTSIDGSTWTNLGSRVTSNTVYYDSADGPFGLLRVGAASVSSGSARAYVVGWPVPITW